MKRAPLGVMRRNAVVVAMNQLLAAHHQPDDPMRTEMFAIASRPDEDPLVRDAAIEATRRLGAQRA